MALLTIVSYNIYGARHRAVLRTVVRALAPDVLVVSETPKVPLIWRWQCDRLARSWGMRRAAGGRDAGSNMICVSPRVEVLDGTTRRLAQPRFNPRRGIVTVQCAADGKDFGVVGVHLSLIARSRPAEAAEAVSDSRRLRGPLLLCGDFNESPHRPAWQVFREAGLVDNAEPAALTSPAGAPANRIDGLLVRGAAVVEHGVPAVQGIALDAASDHLPVLARVEIS